MDSHELEELLSIGESLLVEKDIDRLLDMILQKTRRLLRADAGSIFLAEGNSAEEPTHLRFKLSQNDSVPVKFEEFLLPISPKNLAGYVASTRNTIRFDDVYLIPAGLPFGFNRDFDQRTGYRSKSVLSVSMTDHRGNLIGVVQLWNKKKDLTLKITPDNVASEVTSFTEIDQRLLSSLAGQAGIAIENARLYEEISHLFESFIRASVNAIESRDPTTSGHSERVARLCVGLAKVVHESTSGNFRTIHFSPQELRELEYASLLHDFGKIGVREAVLVKAKKLYPEEFELVMTRFELLQKAIDQKALISKISHLENGGKSGDATWVQIETTADLEKQKLLEAMKLVQVSNEPKVLPEEASHRLTELHQWMIETSLGEKIQVVTEEQVHRLMIPKGSLSEQERLEIEAHVTHTYRYLERIPWTRDLRNIPAIAYAHHEKLNGKGYPRKILSGDIPIQSKMMAVVDIFDALTASDRPYKKAMPALKALDILKIEVDQKQLDENLVQLFIDSRVYELTTRPA